MDEHDDDIEPEVEENVEIETSEYPILDDEDAAEADADEETDPDESEL